MEITQGVRDENIGESSAHARTHEREEDVRRNPLLPLMEEDSFGVARVNRFDDGSFPEQIRTIHVKILHHVHTILRDHVPDGALDSIESFSSMVDFTLLHEFSGNVITQF